MLHKQVKTASTNLTWLYFYFHISIQIFCALFICFVLDGLLQSVCLRMFCSIKVRLLLITRTYQVGDLSLLTHFTSNLDFVKLFTVENFLIRILWIETPYKFRTIKC